jgi:hypothetical protein
MGCLCHIFVDKGSCASNFKIHTYYKYRSHFVAESLTTYLRHPHFTSITWLWEIESQKWQVVSTSLSDPNQSQVSTCYNINLVVTFYDMHGRKRERQMPIISRSRTPPKPHDEYQLSLIQQCKDNARKDKPKKTESGSFWGKNKVLKMIKKEISNGG